MTSTRFLKLFLFLSVVLVVGRASAQTTVVVSDPKSRFPIAIPQLCLAGGSTDANKQIPEVISRDLELSGYFDVLNPNSYIESSSKCVKPDAGEYGDWQMIRTQWLVRGVVDGFGRNVRIQMYLHDVSGQKAVLGKEYQGDIGDVRKIAHKFSNEIMKYVTGESGPFGTQVAFVSKIGRFKELFVMDMDGANVRQLTNERGLALSPGWDHAGQNLLYTNYRSRVPDLFVLNVGSGRSQQITKGPNLEVGGAFLQNDSAILTSLSQDKGSDLVVYGLGGEMIRRLTPSNGTINVSPSYSPDGSQVAFCSDRAGKPQIYLMGSDGSGARRVSFVTSDYCTSPAWSPKGDRLAFVCRADGGNQLFIANADGSNPLQLTSGGHNEDPSWSPDGRYLVFSSTFGGRSASHIALIRVARNLEGSAMSQLTSNRGDDLDPAWGPLP